MSRISKNRLMWIAILMGFLYYFLYLMFSKKFLLFVHPRMGKFIVFSIVTLILIIIRECKKVGEKANKQRIKPGYILFLLPLFAGIFVNPQNISANISSNRNINIPDVRSQSTTNTPKTSKAVVKTVKIKGIIEDGKININPDNMSFVIDDMYTNPAKYENKKIELEGFVLREKSFKVTEIVVARLLMTCCTADTSVIGLMADYYNAASFKANAWIKVSGTIKVRKAINHEVYNSDIMPYIKVDSIKEVKAPMNEYVY